MVRVPVRVATKKQRKRTSLGSPAAIPPVLPPELRGPEEVWNGLGGDVVAQAHPNGARGEDDIALASVPSGERIRVLAREVLANALHGDALGNGLGGEVGLAPEGLFAVVGNGTPVNLQRSLHAEDRLPGALLGDVRLLVRERFANLGAELDVRELGHDGRTVEHEDGGVRELGPVGKGCSPRVLGTPPVLVLDLLGQECQGSGELIVLSSAELIRSSGPEETDNFRPSESTLELG